MIKTVMRETKVFDTNILREGQKVFYTFSHPDGTSYDYGSGELYGIEENELFVGYSSEFDTRLDYLTNEIIREYKEVFLTPEDLECGIHKIELLSE